MATPTKFSPEMAKSICDQIANGRSLREICAQSDMPNRSTVRDWLLANDEFRKAYDLARESQADALFDEIQEIADTGNAEDTQRARLRVDTLKWRLGRMAPKRYGDRVAMEHSGPNGTALPPAVTIYQLPSNGRD